MEREYSTPMEVYQIGDIIDYKVRKICNNFCELIDEKTGINSYLKGTNQLALFPGQIIKCRVLAVREKHPKIELVDVVNFDRTQQGLSEAVLTELIEARQFNWNSKNFVKLLLTEAHEGAFERHCHQWIQSILNKKLNLEAIRLDCTNLLELSDLLNLCSENSREFYQDRLTQLIELMEHYVQANLLLQEKPELETGESPTQFIETLLEKLNTSGYLYHPRKNFSILSILFRLKPELMTHYMSSLLDIIQKKDLKLWKREPFLGALIKLLELYNGAREKQANKTKHEFDLTDSHFRALAIQLLLLKGEKSGDFLADYRLNASRLALVSSYMHSHARSLIDAAYHILFHSTFKLPDYGLSEISILPHYLSNGNWQSADITSTFIQSNMRIEVSPRGIELIPCSMETQELKAVFPEKLDLWQHLQIYLPYRLDTSLNFLKANDLTPYQKAWVEIERAFFDIAQKSLDTKPLSRKHHHVGEVVDISFTGQDPIDKSKFFCQIEDEIGGIGTISLSNIVNYPLNVPLRHFYTKEGSRLIFEAKITGQEAGGNFLFSMIESVTEVARDLYEFEEDIYCSVGASPSAHGLSPGISREGVSISLTNARDYPEIARRDMVRCRKTGIARYGTFHIECHIVEVLDEEEALFDFHFDLPTAFKRLMYECSVDSIAPEASSKEHDAIEDQILNSDQLMSEFDVRQLIYMIDRLATIHTEYIQSYNYLGFARLLSLLIGWESQAIYYKGRMDIISLLHDFAVNLRVDEAKLTQLHDANAELFSNNQMLRERFLQLQSVSYLNRNDHNKDLLELATQAPNVQQIATLVYAYNVIKRNGLENGANDVHNKIIQILHLKGYETGLKLYGTGLESESVEYKSSCVFPADSNFSLPDLNRQMGEILKVINSFLNTQGGTLYIGVNDHGLGIGVENDLEAEPFFGSKDLYLRKLIDMVISVWGNAVAATYIRRVEFDPDNSDKDVVIVEVLRHPTGVPYKGYWYVRTGGSKRSLTEEEFRLYQEMRCKELPQASKMDPYTEVKEEPCLPSTTERERTGENLLVETSPQLVSAAQDSPSSSSEEKIPTSRLRYNVCVDYEDPDHYSSPVCFFKFLRDGKFVKMNDYDYDDTTLLTLAVKEEEKNGYLVLGYANGHIAKVSVAKLRKYTNNQEYIRNEESPLLFASIAQPNDGILSISRENKSKGRKVVRIDNLSKFGENRLSALGTLPYKEGLSKETLAYEIIPEAELTSFKQILNRGDKILGLPDSPLIRDITNRLHLWGISEI